MGVWYSPSPGPQNKMKGKRTNKGRKKTNRIAKFGQKKGTRVSQPIKYLTRGSNGIDFLRFEEFCNESFLLFYGRSLRPHHPINKKQIYLPWPLLGPSGLPARYQISG